MKTTSKTAAIWQQVYGNQKFFFGFIGMCCGVGLFIGALIIDLFLHNFKVGFFELYNVNPIHFVIATSPLALGFLGGIVGIRGDRIEIQRKEIEVSNQTLFQRNNEMRDIMEHIGEGILTINRDYSINKEYSTFLENIFKKTNLASFSFMQLVAHGLNDEKRQQLEEFLEMLFSNTTASEEILIELNPIKRLEIASRDTPGEVEVKYLEIEFTRIITDNVIEKAMVNVRDLTEKVLTEQKLKREQQDHEEEIERIASIINISTEEVNDFIAKSKKLSTEIESMFSKGGWEKINLQILEETQRKLHSLKGEARLFSLQQVAVRIHSLEDLIKIQVSAELKKENPDFSEGENSLSEEQKMKQAMEIMMYLSEFNITLLKIEETKNKIAEKMSTETTAQAGISVQEKEIIVEQLELMQNNLTKLTEHFASKDSGNSEWALKLPDLIARSARQLSEDGNPREVFPLEIQSTISKEKMAKLSVLRDSIIHLVQNSLYHGIESPDERNAKGKNRKGKIDIHISQKDSLFEILIKDDGRGIDLPQIQKVLKAKGEMPVEQIDALTIKDCARLIFQSGFSSAAKLSNIAGRGIGMDVVRHQVQSFKGKIRIHNRKTGGLEVRIHIPESSLLDK